MKVNLTHLLRERSYVDFPGLESSSRYCELVCEGMELSRETCRCATNLTSLWTVCIAVRFAGGCGACVVFVSRYNKRCKKMEEMTVNSCLTLLCSLDGYAITTTEGLGNQESGHHAIHKRMSGFHASQCGFCTPGMTMALYGTLRNSISKSRENAQADRSKVHLTAAAAELAIAGNLCRCTGYRPLLDACKSFSDEVDLEDLGLREFHEENGLPPYDPTRDPIFPQFLIEEYETRESLERENGGISASVENGTLGVSFLYPNLSASWH